MCAFVDNYFGLRMEGKNLGESVHGVWREIPTGNWKYTLYASGSWKAVESSNWLLDPRHLLLSPIQSLSATF